MPVSGKCRTLVSLLRHPFVHQIEGGANEHLVNIPSMMLICTINNSCTDQMVQRILIDAQSVHDEMGIRHGGRHRTYIPVSSCPLSNISEDHQPEPLPTPTLPSIDIVFDGGMKNDY